MIVYLRTYRYGVQADMTYHGSRLEFDDEYNWLTIHEPWIEGQDVPAVLTQVTLVNGDEFTVTQCSMLPDQACGHADI